MCDLRRDNLSMPQFLIFKEGDNSEQLTGFLQGLNELMHITCLKPFLVPRKHSKVSYGDDVLYAEIIFKAEGWTSLPKGENEKRDQD